MKERAIDLKRKALDLMETRFLRIALVVLFSMLLGFVLLSKPPLFVLGGTMVMFFAILVLISPFLGVMSLVVLEYVRIVDLVPVFKSIRPSLLLALTIFFSWMLHVTVYKKERFVLPRQLYVLAAFVLIMSLSVFGAYLRVNAANTVKNFVEYALFCFLIFQLVNTRQRLKTLFWMFIASNAVLALMCLPKLLFHYDQVVGRGLGLGSFLGDGNDFALAMNVVIPFTLFLFLRERLNRMRILFLGLLLIFITNVVLSGSRGGTITLIATGVLFVIRSPRRAMSLVLVAVALVSILWLSPERYFGRMSTIAEYGEDQSAQGRLNAWKASIRMALDRPLLGVGAGNFLVNYQWFYRPVGESPDSVVSVHSIYFQTLSELGFTGLFVYLLFVVFNLVDDRKVRTQLDRLDPEFGSTAYYASLGLDVSIIAFLVAGTFLTVAYYPHLFVLTGLVVSLRNCVERRGMEESA